MTREPFDLNPMGYTPDDVARWLLDRLRCFGVLPRDLIVTDLMGYGGIFLTREDDGTRTLAPAVFEAIERLAGQKTALGAGEGPLDVERTAAASAGSPKSLPWPSRR